MSKSRTSKVAAGTLTAFLQYGLQMVLQIALAPLVLKYAGKETLGAYAIITQVVGQLTLLDFGFTTTLMRYLANAHGYDDAHQRFRNVFTTGRSFLMASSLILSLTIILLSFWVGSLFSLSPAVNSQARLALLLLGIWTAFRTPIALYDLGLFSMQNQKISNIFAMINNSLRLVLSLILVISGHGLVGLMLASIVSELTGLLISRWYFKRLYPQIQIGWGFPEKTLFKEMFKFGFQIMLMNIVSRLIFGTDNIIVGYLFNATAVAAYYTTQMPTFASFVLIWKLSDNAAPAINELIGRGNFTSLRSGYNRLYRYTMLMTIPFVLGIIFFNKPLVTFWVGSGQYAGDLMSLFLAFFCFIAIISHLNAAFLVAFGVIWPFIVFGLFEAAVKLSLSFVLGRLYGIQWIMVASVVAAVPGFIYMSLITIRCLKLSIKEFWREAFYPPLISCVFSLPILLVMFAYRSNLTLISFFAFAGIFLLSCALGSFIWGLSVEDKTQIWQYTTKACTPILRKIRRKD